MAWWCCVGKRGRQPHIYLQLFPDFEKDAIVQIRMGEDGTPENYYLSEPRSFSMRVGNQLVDITIKGKALNGVKTVKCR
jgi:hypothetical protein